MTIEQMTPYRATGLAEGFVEGSDEERLEAWQYLHDTGLAYRPQGSFGRMASQLVHAGVIHA